MNVFDILYGNEGLKTTLKGFSSRRAFPNSLIISGEEGSGKYTAATLCAMAIACENNDRPCGECPSCSKIKRSISPDVITISIPKDRKTIGVDAVREIRGGAYIMPNDLNSKIYIIKNAEKMTEQAQNALLKLFEEGPENTYFFLLAENSSSLLSTVRSRAPEIKTELFTPQKLSELLVENVKKAAELKDKDEASFNRIINVAGGSYGRALSLLESRSKKSTSLHEKAEELIEAMSKDTGTELLLCLLSEITDREKYVSLLKLTGTGLRDLCAVKRAEEQSLLLFASREKAAELSERFSLKALVSLTKTIGELVSDVAGTNINLRTAAITAYGRIRDCK